MESTRRKRPLSPLQVWLIEAATTFCTVFLLGLVALYS